MKPSSASEADMTDLMGSGDTHEESEDDKLQVESSEKAGQQSDSLVPSNVWAPLGTGVWADENDDMEERSDDDDMNMRLPKVLKAFQCLKEVFDGNFKQMWA